MPSTQDQDEVVVPPESFAELVCRCSPEIERSRGQLMLLVTRSDEPICHGGPEHESSPTYVRTHYHMAVIAQEGKPEDRGGEVVFPVSSAVMANSDSVNVIPWTGLSFLIFDLAGMHETVEEVLDVDDDIKAVLRLQTEILIGDGQIRDWLSKKRNEKELLLVASLAQELRRPIEGSPALDAVAKHKVSALADKLIRAIFGPKPTISVAAVDGLLGELMTFGFDPRQASLKCLEQLVAELKQGLRLSS